MKVKELFSDALPIISKFAPTIGNAIGGPFGVAAGYIIPVLADAFGVHLSQISGLPRKILSDTAAQEKLEQIETEHGAWVDGLMDSVNNLAKAEINVKLEWQPASKQI